MSVQASDLVAYQSANMPEDDTAACGGAISTAGIVTFTDIAATDQVEAVSSAAGDTMNLTVTGCDAGGAIVSETQALTGTTAITFSSLGAIERFLKAELASAAAGTVTIRRATDDVTIAQLAAGVTSCRRLFYDAASEPTQTVRYEKFFFRNNHSTDTLTNAQVTLTADPSASVRLATEDAKDDTNGVANRKAAPTSNQAWVDDSVAQSIPTGQFAGGEAIGVWVEFTRAADAPAVKTTFTARLAGTTT